MTTQTLIPKKAIIFSVGLLLSLSQIASAIITQSITLHGQPKYPANFSAFQYVNPNAPKAGDVKFEANGTFDSLNPFINKGIAAAGITYIYDSLTAKSDDEAFSRYGLLAEKIEYDPNDYSWVIYHINNNAKFSDNTAVTAADVEFTFNLILKDGSPMYKNYYREVAKVEALDKTKVKFTFKSKNNPELRLIVGELPILPKHYWANKKFNDTNLTPPIGSGPYTIQKINNGKSISYARNPNYWAKDLNVNKGRYNFNSMTYIYYRDMTISLEGFKVGQFDLREENKAKTWATEYNFSAIKSGLVKKELIKNENPVGIQGFAFNLRKPLFLDIRVRQALGYAYDFEWANKTLFYNAYTRASSYFNNSELAAKGAPLAEELTILNTYKNQLPASVFGVISPPPKTDGSGNNRSNLMTAQKLLEEAGWKIENGQLKDKNKKAFSFEILIAQPELERVIQPFKQNLQRLGIELKIRVIDVQQYIERMRKVDFDMIVNSIPSSLSPGNELFDHFGSAAADQAGSRNLIGIKNSVVDALLTRITQAKTRESLVNTTKALDRVLWSQHYLIPQYYIGSYRVAYWDIFEKPKVSPKYDLGVDNWWINSNKLNAIRSKQKGQP